MTNSKFTKVFRMGHGVPQSRHARRASSCASGFYKTPAASQTVAYPAPLDISWDTSCMTTPTVDIYLYAPGASNPRIHLWENVDFNAGGYQATLKPKWWNATSSASLQLAIVEAGTPPFLATLPAGPVFTATYTAPSSGASPADADITVPDSPIQDVSNIPPMRSLPKNKIAAAVLVPLLLVAIVVTYLYVKAKRQQGKEDRKRWSQAIDARMSVIAPEWSSVSVAGAQAAIRQSMAVGEASNRASSFSFGGGIRPSSTAAVDGGHAGIGTPTKKSGIDTTTPQMSQLRSGPRIAVNTGERVSRVSFAADTRPSGESRRSAYNTRTSRAFHVGHVPPLPTRQQSGDMSPTQASGPLTLTAADITARMSGIDTAPRPSVDEVMPALAMMRTGLVSTDDLLLPPKPATPPIPSPPAATHQVLKSPVGGLMPMQPMPANVMSPDEMLRAYAEGRSLASPPPTGGLTFPAPIANYNGNGMRTLYSPTTPTSAAYLLPETPQSDYRTSASPSEHSRYEEEMDDITHAK